MRVARASVRKARTASRAACARRSARTGGQGPSRSPRSKMYRSAIMPYSTAWPTGRGRNVRPRYSNSDGGVGGTATRLFAVRARIGTRSTPSSKSATGRRPASRPSTSRHTAPPATAHSSPSRVPGTRLPTPAPLGQRSRPLRAGPVSSPHSDDSPSIHSDRNQRRDQATPRTSAHPPGRRGPSSAPSTRSTPRLLDPPVAPAIQAAPAWPPTYR